jgi:hypothetical protein
MCSGTEEAKTELGVVEIRRSTVIKKMKKLFPVSL